MWAFGCVLFEMLTGRGAFAADDGLGQRRARPRARAGVGSLPPTCPRNDRETLETLLAERHGRTTARHRRREDRNRRSVVPPRDPSRDPRSACAAANVARSRGSAIGAVVLAHRRLRRLAMTRSTSGNASPRAAAVEFGVMFPGNQLPSFGLAAVAGRQAPRRRCVRQSVADLAALAENVGNRPLAGTEDGDIAVLVARQLDGRVLPARPTVQAQRRTPVRAPRSRTTGRARSAEAGIRMATSCSPRQASSFASLPRAERRSKCRCRVSRERRFCRRFCRTAVILSFWHGKGTADTRPSSSVDSDRVKSLFEVDGGLGFAPPDRLLFLRGAWLMTQKIDLTSFELIGDPEVVASGVSPGHLFGRQQMRASASGNGVLAYLTPLGGSVGQLTWFDRNGRSVGRIESPPDVEYPESLDFARRQDRRRQPRGSPDRQLGYLAGGCQSERAVEVHDRSGTDFDPVWSPDGKEIVYRLPSD